MARALVTGITGQDGSYLAERLLADGWEVHGLVRAALTEPGQPVDPRVVTHAGELADEASLRNVVAEAEPEVVFNLAGVSSVATSWNRPAYTAHVTGEATIVLLDAAWALQEAKGIPVRFLQASSSEIFGEARSSPQTEGTIVRPTSPYGAAKAFAHHAVGVYRARGLFASSTILYNHESPRRPMSFVTRKITSQVARISLGLDHELVLGNLDARRDWGWAPDFVDAMVLAASADIPDDFIVATGVSHSVREFVAAAFAAAGVEAWEHYVHSDDRFTRPTDPAEMCGDATKIHSTLGWTTTLSFEELVAAMVRHDVELYRGGAGIG
jgi:GDPmannose 4,6-dehydratase